MSKTTASSNGTLAKIRPASVLTRFETARRALAEARSIDEVKQVRDQAEALRLYVKQQGDSLEMQNAVAEIKLRAERKAGELLAATEKNKGAATRSHDVTAPAPRLKDLGISKMQSSRWQLEARLPEQFFEQHIAEVKASMGELTSAGLIDLAKQHTRKATEANAESATAKYVTLAQWEQLPAKVRKELLETQGDSTFNPQGDTEGIEWALWSWNPVTGCLHNCPYCYARDTAERFYEQQFKPSFWPDRLAAPKNTPFPKEKAKEWMGHKNVFVCSMADLFGRWVPDEWIEAVLAAARGALQWNFLFLTKFPIRLAEFEFPKNAWVGTTVDCQARVANAEKAFRKVKASVKWLSCEPLIEPLTFGNLGAFDWLVLGGASKSNQTPEWHPPRRWVVELEEQAEKAGVRIYEKPNLSYRRRDYPGVEPYREPGEAPQALRYLIEADKATK